MNYLRVWGCKEVVRLSDQKLKTLGERGIKCIFVGYPEHSKAFRLYVIEPNESFSINLISESRDAIFDENIFSSVPRPSQRSLKDGTEDIGGSVVSEEVTEEGFRQKSRIDYFDTYALVTRISIIRLLIAMASIHNLIIHQMDVKTTFLNGELEEEVYTNHPQGFIMPDNENKVDLTKEFLSSRISIKDIGEVDVILGIRIKHESNGIAISQSHYIEKVLEKFNYFDCTPVSTPIDKSDKLMPNNGQAVSQLKYSRVIGCLMYAMTYTRPDIAFVVGKLSRYTSNSGTQDWQAIQRVLKYLKKTMDYRLNYIGYPSVLEGYTDASWINNTEENSFTSGWCCYIAYSQMYNGKSRHLVVRYSMIRELITNEVVSIEFVRSQQNLADHLTKGLARDLVIKSTEGM
ncbi:zinc finger, CCHC-type containing protein [Tanacetum coccineum]